DPLPVVEHVRLGRFATAKRVPGDPHMLDDGGDRKNDVDRVQIVERHSQIGGLLALHEDHIVPGCGQRDDEQNDQCQAGDHRESTAGTLRNQLVDDVEPDLVLV